MNKQKRHTLKLLGCGSVSFLALTKVWAGAQKEEYLADSVASAMSRSINNANPPRLIFPTPEAAQKWFWDMNQRLRPYVFSAYERRNILINLQYEASRAGLDPQLILGLVEVESHFHRYAISKAGARGLMQVMPFWVRQIGRPEHNLFSTRTNLRYGCTILRYYLDRDGGNLFRALSRYNGSLGKAAYPNAVVNAMRLHWLY